MTNQENKQNHNNYLSSLNKVPFYCSRGVINFFTEQEFEPNYFLTLVYTEILPLLKDDLFFIYLKVNEDKTAKITVQRDKGQPILYEKDFKTDFPYSIEPYKFCLDVYPDNSILCLLSER